MLTQLLSPSFLCRYPFFECSTDADVGVYIFSGMPECKLGLNDRVLLEAQGRATKGKAIDLDDIKFHQYVTSSTRI